MVNVDSASAKIVIIGGGPGGYEAANYAASAGAEVVLIERQGLGGSAVLSDVVPSKALIAAVARKEFEAVSNPEEKAGAEWADALDMEAINNRIVALARSQSADILESVKNHGVRVIEGSGKLQDGRTVMVYDQAGELTEKIAADAILLAVGASPRELEAALVDGERIFTWKQIYALKEIPEHLIIVGSGVTGAEFASAFKSMGREVTLISSRERVLPGEDPDAAKLLENIFKKRGMTVLSNSRAKSVTRTGRGVVVTLEDRKQISGSHCLMCVGAIPNTTDTGLEEAGIELTPSGHIKVDNVCRTTVPGVYAAGDCTGLNPLASAAAVQGRLAIAHIVGCALKPLNLTVIPSNIFTVPEIATVGVTQAQIDAGEYRGYSELLPLHTNARAKMLGITEGFVKIISRTHSGTVIGAVVVAPGASELIYPLTLAVQHRLGSDDLAYTSTVYPSLSGSLAEAARRSYLRGGRAESLRHDEKSEEPYRHGLLQL